MVNDKEKKEKIREKPRKNEKERKTKICKEERKRERGNELELHGSKKKGRTKETEKERKINM